MNKSILFILALVLLPLFVVAQVDYVSDFNRLTDYNTADDEKQALSLQLTEALMADLQEANFSVDSFSIRQLKVVHSPDGAVDIYTWHYSLSDATAQYGGIVKHDHDFWPLQFNDRPITDDQKYAQDDWCGGIYYDIIPVKKKENTLYTLLSWDGNNGVTSKKIIDVLSFDRKGRPIFGLPIFTNGHSTSHRVVLEYAASGSMFLAYNAGEDGIVCNAVFANEDKFASVSAYQNTSDDFNMYCYQDSKWKLYINVDLLMNKRDSKALQNNADRPSSGL